MCVFEARPTDARPPEGVVLIARLAFTAVGAGLIVAQLALPALMQTALTLVHIYETHKETMTMFSCQPARYILFLV